MRGVGVEKNLDMAAQYYEMVCIKISPENVLLQCEKITSNILHTINKFFEDQIPMNYLFIYMPSK